MKNIVFILLAAISLPSLHAQQQGDLWKITSGPAVSEQVMADKADRNNNFYDNEETIRLPLNKIYVGGEIENPGQVEFEKLAKHSVIVKEALLKDDTGNIFIGAFRYDGYSLFDILSDRILVKKNAAEFRPVIDVYIEIENDEGEKVVLSWGEIFYPNVLQNTIIATGVMRIIPSKTKDLWPLPTNCKLVVGHDLVSERNISRPTKITIHSYSRNYKVDRDINPLVSEQVVVYQGEKQLDGFKAIPPGLQTGTVHTIFYGRGRGIHSTRPFSGIYIKDYLAGRIPANRENLRTGLVVFAGIDGYRSVFSLSEIMNRSDQADILLVSCPEESDGGKFRIFPSCDFFSDRAVKALCEIRVENK